MNEQAFIAGYLSKEAKEPWFRPAKSELSFKTNPFMYYDPKSRIEHHYGGEKTWNPDKYKETRKTIFPRAGFTAGGKSTQAWTPQHLQKLKQLVPTLKIKEESFTPTTMEAGGGGPFRLSSGKKGEEPILHVPTAGKKSHPMAREIGLHETTHLFDPSIRERATWRKLLGVLQPGAYEKELPATITETAAALQSGRVKPTHPLHSQVAKYGPQVSGGVQDIPAVKNWIESLRGTKGAKLPAPKEQQLQYTGGASKRTSGERAKALSAAYTNYLTNLYRRIEGSQK